MNAPDPHLVARFDSNALACLCVGIAPKLSPGKPTPKAAESFNDDDIYIYNAETKEIVRTIPASDALTIGVKYTGVKVLAGQSWAKGMSCKRMGLWISRQDAAGVAR